MLINSYEDFKIFNSRREKLNELTDNSVFIFFSGSESYLSNFRAQSSFVYLTGFEEPDSCAVIRTGKDKSFTLFLRPRDPDIEIWDGERYGLDRAKEIFNCDKTFAFDNLHEELKFLIKGADKIYYKVGVDNPRDQLIFKSRAQAQQLDRRSGKAEIPIFDPNEILGPMRVIKDDNEKQWMREICKVSGLAHLHVMKNVKKAKNERQVQGDLLYSFYQQNASREGYSSIIASGVNATTLHYRANNKDIKPGEFLLIDAGAEKKYYTADITRTYPVNGTFTKAQKSIYQSVLDVQKKLISLAKIGFSLIELQEQACLLLTEQMIELGLLKGNLSDLIEQKAYHKYYPHGVGHYLGMDVHDVGFSKINDKPNPLQAGMVITVEPGIYVPENDNTAPKELRGLGVRIEDDILIGLKDPEVLTRSAPKEIAELESLINN
jgi:Xaa-Pro aminopeptidase